MAWQACKYRKTFGWYSASDMNRFVLGSRSISEQKHMTETPAFRSSAQHLTGFERRFFAARTCRWGCRGSILESKNHDNVKWYFSFNLLSPASHSRSRRNVCGAPGPPMPFKWGLSKKLAKWHFLGNWCCVGVVSWGCYLVPNSSVNYFREIVPKHAK